VSRRVVIVQARVGSSRLPGKVLADLSGRPVLQHVLTRCARIPGIDAVTCAVPDEQASEALETIARDCSASYFRGSERDVLGRYLGAARATDADIVMRVTSDCPLIDPQVCGRVLALRESASVDYVSNVAPRSFPQGLDCEVFTRAALELAAANASDTYDREHVTPWLRRAPRITRANLESGDPALADHRWTLDYDEDLAFFRAVFAALPVGSEGAMDDVLALLARRPDLLAINAAHRVKATA
jgi:glutamate-1-semialdehyde 2,1-aminomutase/spore coat polysaccharide biosynthesis protein SpsF